MFFPPLLLTDAIIMVSIGIAAAGSEVGSGYSNIIIHICITHIVSRKMIILTGFRRAGVTEAGLYLITLLSPKTPSAGYRLSLSSTATVGEILSVECPLVNV